MRKKRQPKRRPDQIDDIKGKQIKSWSGSTVSEIKSLGEAIKLVIFLCFKGKKKTLPQAMDYLTEWKISMVFFFLL